MTQPGLIPDEWIVAYASGGLSEAKATLVATHAAYHPVLQHKITDAEAIGGALLENCDKADVADDMFDKVMARLEGAAARADKSDEVRLNTAPIDGTEHWPKPLADYIAANSKKLRWRFMGPGMRQMKLWKGENGECLWLLKAKGGTVMPEHDHTGQEMTLVLEGSYHVGDQQYARGDLEIASSDIENHTVHIDEGDDCICLVVTEAPIKLKSMVGRAFQPFIGL